MEKPNPENKKALLFEYERLKQELEAYYRHCDPAELGEEWDASCEAVSCARAMLHDFCEVTGNDLIALNPVLQKEDIFLCNLPT